MFTYFYHERIRKAVATFGRLFNDIHVLRRDTTGSQIYKQSKVPLAYAPRAKFLERIREQEDLADGQRVAVKLPRMSFEIIGIAYDPTRQLQKTTVFSQAGSAASLRTKINAYTPYVISFQLSVYSKTQDDALQIVEQILPYFNPQYNVSLKPFANYPAVVEDVPITITGVDFNDDFEGPVETRRTIIYTLSFDMKLNFYGPLNDGKVITTATLPIDVNTPGIGDSDFLTITVTPTPTGVSADSDFGFLETFTENF